MNDNRQRYEADKKLLAGNNKEIHYKGYKGVIVQHPNVGHLCGYVVIPEDHPLYQKNYDEIDLEVHGELTYSDSDLISVGEDFCIGFDCAHAGDWIPMYGFENDTYKDITFVENEIKSLIDQIKDNEKESNAATLDSKENLSD